MVLFIFNVRFFAWRGEKPHIAIEERSVYPPCRRSQPCCCTAARVYALFDLTPAEIAIVEERTKYKYGEV